LTNENIDFYDFVLLFGLSCRLVLVSQLRSLWWFSNSSSLGRSDSDNVCVDSTGDAVLHLDVELWDRILFIHGSLLQISLGSSINHVSNCESLDSLVLRAASSTVGASHRVNVSSVLTVLSSVTSLLRHLVRPSKCNV
jgi:hypothetical protein